jgi:hypothetical protein
LKIPKGGKHNSYIDREQTTQLPKEEEQTTQWPKEKVQKDNNDLQNIHTKLKIE